MEGKICMFNNGSGAYSLSDIAATTERNNNDGFCGDGGAWWIIILFLFCFAGWGGNGFGNNGRNGTTTREEIAYGFDMNGLENGVRGVQNGLCDGFYALNTGLLNGFSGAQNTMAQGFAGINAAINGSTSAIQGSIQDNAIANMQNSNALMAKMQDCCCQNERLTMQSNYDAAMRAIATDNIINSQFSTLNYNLADQGCTTRRAITDSTRDIIDNQNAGIRSILDFLTQDKIASLTSENAALKAAADNAMQTQSIVNQLRPSPTPAYVVANPYCNCGNGYGYNYNGCSC